VFRRHSFRGVTMLVVEQPDGTLTHVPEWMCAPTAASAAIRDGTRFPLEVLLELRIAADAALASLSGSNDGRAHGTARIGRAARSVRIAGISWAPEAKRELLAVIETLLLETMPETVAREAGDEQDHA
jgi:hypothetical protein